MSRKKLIYEVILYGGNIKESKVYYSLYCRLNMNHYQILQCINLLHNKGYCSIFNGTELRCKNIAGELIEHEGLDVKVRKKE